MPDFEDRAPWKDIASIVERGDADELNEFLETLSTSEVARAMSRLDDHMQSSMMTLLEPEDAADLIEELPDAQGADVIEDLPAKTAAAIVDEMESDERVDLLGEMDNEDAEAILREMAPEEAEDARKLLTYEQDSAGGIMVTEFVSYRQNLQVSDVLNDLREHAEEYSDQEIHYAYVESDNGTLIGVAPLRELLLARSSVTLSSLMIPNPIFVTVETHLDELQQLFDRYHFVCVPVTDENGRLVGLVRRADAEEVYGERSEKRFMKFSGIVGGDELRNMPLISRSIGRLSWLTVNMILNVIAAAVIVFFEDIIGKFVALAVVLPIICNMSGCSGNQAVAVSIREMTLGIIRPRDYVLVLLKELQVGLINGICLGALLWCVTTFWEKSPMLGLIVGGALALNTVVAVILGGAIPLLFKAFKIDPAIAAAPVLTTIIDMCGFFLILGFATYADSQGWLDVYFTAQSAIAQVP